MRLAGLPGRNPEAGFALLYVYAMAATVAIMLLMSMPRGAFEAQREKEQLLIDRGEEYTRAIQLYVRKFNRYPADFQALDNTGGQRFLRHRYKDPMSSATGEDNEWRIIHVGPGGVFTDSLLYSKKKDPKAEQQNFIAELAPIGGAPTVPGQQFNLADRRRPSDQPGAPGDPNNPNPQGIPPPPPDQPNLQFPPGVQPPPGVQIPGTNLQPGINGTPSAAIGLINNILTTPRPGGAPGFPFPGQPPQQPIVDQFGRPLPQQPLVQGGLVSPIPGQPIPGQPIPGQPIPGQPIPGQPIPQQPNAVQQIGGGIAGIASKTERDGIKLYRDEQSYHRWEFVYDLSRDKSRAGAGQPGAAPGQLLPPPPGTTPGQPPPPLPPGNGQIPPGLAR